MVTDNEFQWRACAKADCDGLRALDEACIRVDGEEAVPLPATRFLDAPPQSLSQVAFTAEGECIAAGLIIRQENAAVLRGKVHPDYRARGLGTRLLGWQEAHARQPATPLTLVIRNEAFSADASTLYLRHGYHAAMIENWMRRDLTQPLPAVPATLQQVAWDRQSAYHFFEAYQGAFRDRPGFYSTDPNEWINEYAEDDEFRADLSFVAFEHDTPAAFITSGIARFHGYDIGWINQIGTLPAYRGRGLASALLIQALRAFQAENLPFADLHVNVNNPGAFQLYEGLGFRVRGQRAKYTKTID